MVNHHLSKWSKSKLNERYMNITVIPWDMYSALQSFLLQLCTGHSSAETTLKDWCGVLQRDARAVTHRDSQPPAHVSLKGLLHMYSLYFLTFMTHIVGFYSVSVITCFKYVLCVFDKVSLNFYIMAHTWHLNSDKENKTDPFSKSGIL